MARVRKGSPTLIRDLNRAATLSVIGQQGPIARVEIARRLSLSPATVTEVTRDLIDEGLVEAVEQAASRGGRPAVLLGIVPEAGSALGAKVSPDRLALVEVDLHGEIISHADEPFDAQSPDAVDALLARLEDAVRQRARRARTGRLLGVGLGVPGTVDPHAGTVQSPLLGWDGIPLASHATARLGVPVLVDNDVNTLAVAERLYDRGREREHFLTLTIGRGVGLGIIVAGDLYRGAHGGAGEFGHLPVQLDGPDCECGLQGCLEALVADPALASQAAAEGLLPHGLPVREARTQLRELADQGDRTAARIFATAGATLGRAVAGLVNVLSPELIIVSGEGSDAWTHLEASFRRELDRATFPSLRGTEVAVDPWDDAKWARGAAALVLRATFAPPIYEHVPDAAVRERLAGTAATARPTQQPA
ncbi:MAG: ROK family transcriptional regulator [Chloroflexota bacterium]